MIKKRFKFACDDENCFFKDNEKVLYCYEVVELLNTFNDENEQLKQYKQAVSDVLKSWSQKNLSAKQLQMVIAIMEELNVMGELE